MKQKNDGFDMKFEFAMCIWNGEEKSWVSDKVWICINKEIKGNEAKKWWGLMQSIYIYIIRQWGRKIMGSDIKFEFGICIWQGKKILGFWRSVDLH